MTVIELYINDKLMKLSDKTRIGYTKQANNLGELQNRQGDFTNTFKIPINDHNKAALEWSNLMTSATVIPYRRNTARYIEEGIEIVTDGEAILKKTDDKYYYVDIVSGNVDLARAIGDTIVGDLYADDLSHTWNFFNVVNSRLGLDYYMYPLIDWRTDIDTFFDTATIDAREMLPTCAIPGMFDRLETLIGYNFTGSYIDSDEHQDMILTPDAFSVNPLYLSQEETSALYRYTGSFPNSSSAGIFLGGIVVPEGSGTVAATIFPDYNVYDPNFFLINYVPSINHIGVLTFKTLLRILWGRTEPYTVFEQQLTREYYFIARIKDGGTVIAEITSEVFSGKLDNETDFEIEVTTGEINLLTTGNYFCQLDFFVQEHSNVPSAVSVRTLYNEFIHTPGNSIVFGQEIKFRDIFRMKVSDVFKDILNLRGLIHQTNSNTKEVQLNFFQDLIDNKPIALDWSDKVDVRSHQLEFKFGKYSQRNWFRFKPDDNVENELGDFYFDIDDQTLSDESDAVKINHSATEQSNKYLGYNVPEVEAIDSLNKWQKPTYRLLQLEKQDTSFNVDYTDGTSNSNETSSIPFARFNGFELLIPQFYPALIGILDKTKGFTLRMKLNAADIQGFNFVIPIFLDIPQLDINGYFYVNVFSNYKKGITPVNYIRL